MKKLKVALFVIALILTSFIIPDKSFASVNYATNGIARSSVYIRPSIESSRILGILQKDTVITGRNYGSWFKFRYKGKDAFVARSFIDIDPSYSTIGVSRYKLVVRPIKNSTKVLGYINSSKLVNGTEDGAWFKINYKNRTGYVAKKGIDLTNTPIRVSTLSSMYVRSAKSNGRTLGIAKKGTTFEGYVDGNWIATSFNGKKAYIAKKFTNTNFIGTTYSQDHWTYDSKKRDGNGEVTAYNNDGSIKHSYITTEKFVLVDEKNQKLFFFNNGNLIITTGVVTGDVKNGWRSPKGPYEVTGMFKDYWPNLGKRVTEPYHVDYMIAYQNNYYAIHDANWREGTNDYNDPSTFLANGSTGCVNIPLNEMKTIYNSFKLKKGLVIIIN